MPDQPRSRKRCQGVTTYCTYETFPTFDSTDVGFKRNIAAELSCCSLIALVVVATCKNTAVEKPEGSTSRILEAVSVEHKNSLSDTAHTVTCCSVNEVLNGPHEHVVASNRVTFQSMIRYAIDFH
eukprot:1860811-Amphidinium_carterae.1